MGLFIPADSISPTEITIALCGRLRWTIIMMANNTNKSADYYRAQMWRWAAIGMGIYGAAVTVAFFYLDYLHHKCLH